MVKKQSFHLNPYTFGSGVFGQIGYLSARIYVLMG